MRARVRFLDQRCPATSPVNEEYASVERVLFRRSAALTLRRQLQPTGRWIGGLLFGHPQGGALHVKHLSTLGCPAWYSAAEREVLSPDVRYVLGWSDALEAVYGGRIDWVGHWVAAPNSLLPDVREDFAWLDRSLKIGLLDTQHVLVLTGWTRDGELMGRAYRLDSDTYARVDCSVLDLPRPHSE